MIYIFRQNLKTSLVNQNNPSAKCDTKRIQKENDNKKKKRN